VQVPIPGNDDAIRSTTLMCHVMAEAIMEGRYIASKRNPAAAPRRTAEDEAAFASAQAAARSQAAAAQAERDARLAASKTAPAADAVETASTDSQES
jgi:small subunit ribosomal protein S2